MQKGWAIFFYGFGACFTLALFMAAGAAWVTGGATDMGIVVLVLLTLFCVCFIRGGTLAERVD